MTGFEGPENSQPRFLSSKGRPTVTSTDNGGKESNGKRRRERLLAVRSGLTSSTKIVVLLDLLQLHFSVNENVKFIRKYQPAIGWLEGAVANVARLKITAPYSASF